MAKRYAAIWFRHLTTDWLTLHRPSLQNTPFVLARPERGRMRITATSPEAESQGLTSGMSVADAKAFVPGLQVIDDQPGLERKLLRALGLWCIRYTPTVAIDLPDGLVLDISGCAHLWGGERAYLKTIGARLKSKGYDVRITIADTIGVAWAVARFDQKVSIIKSGTERDTLLPLPPAALRLEPNTLGRLHRLGLRAIGHFMEMPCHVLRRRFGNGLTLRLGQALGHEEEHLCLLHPFVPYSERLPCLEPICTAKGIEIALQRLLEVLCKRLSGEGMGLRKAMLSCYRVDGKVERVIIGTSRATAHVAHILGLFTLKIPQIRPDAGIELFVLEAPKVEEAVPVQKALWKDAQGLEGTALAELLDRLVGKSGTCAVRRYLPQENHWPERSFKPARFITEKPTSPWRDDKPRPIRLLARPEPIDVSAPIPDYPPMLFRYRGEVHPIEKADGPERIEREWWMDKGEHRDYYYVEDNKGQRYWLFRSGHYAGERYPQWFIHGFFA